MKTILKGLFIGVAVYASVVAAAIVWVSLTISVSHTLKYLGML